MYYITFLSIIHHLLLTISLQIGVHVPAEHNNDTLIPDWFFPSNYPLTATLLYNNNNHLTAYRCNNIMPQNSGEWNMCTAIMSNINLNCNINDSTINDVISLSSITSTSILQFDISHHDGVWIDGIMVNDTNQVFIWNIFASSLSFPDEFELGINTTGNCEDYNYIYSENENCTVSGSFCLDTDHDCYNHSSLQILLPPNSTQAWIQSAEEPINHDILQMYEYCNETRIISFGIHVSDTPHDESASRLRTTLKSVRINGTQQILQCDLYPDVKNTWFYCDVDATDFIDCVGAESDIDLALNVTGYDDNIAVHFDIVGIDGVWIDKVSVLDSKNNEYIYDTFCSSLYFPYPISTPQPTGHCAVFDKKEWTYFCIDSDDCYGSLDMILSSNYTTKEALIKSSDVTLDAIVCDVESGASSGNDSHDLWQIIAISLSGCIVFCCLVGIFVITRNKIRRRNVNRNNLMINLMNRNSMVTLGSLNTTNDNSDNRYINFESLHGK